jgi:membrane associated rhomboid family serine protease
MTARTMSHRRRDLADVLEISALAVSALFAIHLVRGLLGISAVHLGIVPRTGPGLLGILFGPLLHAHWNHVLANAVPLFLFLILLLSDRRYHPGRTLLVIWMASGIGTWLIGRGHAVHIGASGLIFGLAAYLIVAGFLMRSWRAILVTAIVLLLFGSMFYGVVPQKGPVSWEGHLCGALAGAWTARDHHG